MAEAAGHCAAVPPGATRGSGREAGVALNGAEGLRTSSGVSDMAGSGVRERAGGGGLGWAGPAGREEPPPGSGAAHGSARGGDGNGTAVPAAMPAGIEPAPRLDQVAGAGVALPSVADLEPGRGRACFGGT